MRSLRGMARARRFPHSTYSPLRLSPFGTVLSALLVWSVVLFVTVVFVWILGDILGRGMGQISWEFLTTLPQNAGRDRGNNNNSAWPAPWPCNRGVRG